jgi:hypothetical protein
MKRLSFFLALLSLSVTVVHAQHYWPVTCSASGLKGKVHEVVTMTYFPEDSTGLGLKMVVETRLFSPEGLLTHQFESNPGSDFSAEFIYDGALLTDVYFNADGEYHARYYYLDGIPSMIVVSSKQDDYLYPNDTIMVSYEHGKLKFEPSQDLFTHDIFFSSIYFDETLLESEVVEYDEVGNWIFRKRGKNAQTRHIVYWE